MDNQPSFSIPRAEKKQYYPLSAAQRPLYTVQILAPENLAYNVVDIIPLDSGIDTERIERAMRVIIDRHEILRTSFIALDGIPYQRVNEVVDFSIPVRQVAHDELAATVNELVRPFDLGTAPLFRIYYVERKTQPPVLLLDMHHIICDAISVRQLKEQFQEAFAAIAGNATGSGKTAAAPPQQILQYRDFSEWHEKEKKGPRIRQQGIYWLNKFSDEIPVLLLPEDHPRPSFKSYEGELVHFLLTKHETAALNAISRIHRGTLFMTLLTAYYALLMKISGQEDIVIGIPSTFRSIGCFGKMPGMFVNSLPLRIPIERHLSFLAALEKMKKIVFEALNNQYYQLDDLINDLSVSRDNSRSPLFDVMFNMLNQQDFDIDTQEVIEGKDPHAAMARASQFDMDITCIESNGALLLTLSYNSNLFRRERIQRFATYFQNIIRAVIRNPSIPMRDIDILTEEERQGQLIHYRYGEERPVEGTILDWFERHAEGSPGRIAVVYEDRQLSYGEFHSRVKDLAARLAAKGVGRHSVVPLLMQRSAEMAIAVWGVIRAGGILAPLDPEWPMARICQILADLGTNLLVTNCDLREKGWEEYVLVRPGEGEHPATAGTAVQLHRPGPEDPIYILFTSGSTGTPKGAINLHKGIANRFQYMAGHAAAHDSDVVLLSTNYVFDGALYEILWPLTLGMKLVIPGRSSFYDLDSIVRTIDREGVTITDMIPSVLNVLAERIAQRVRNHPELRSLRHLFVGGEAISPRHAYLLKSLVPGLAITNDYGPTETSIGTIFYELPSRVMDKMPIGSPIDNVRTVIVDRDLRLAPAGMDGELLLSGACLGMGYLNNPELTHEKFVRRSYRDGKGELFYRTGDRVRLGEEGTLFFEGRMDLQVKIRGYRVEPEEIEAVMRCHPAINQAAVLVKENEDGEKFLVAYFAGGITEDEVLSFLGTQLPEYMMPTVAIVLEEIALTAVGKIDRKKLPDPSLDTPGKTYLAPRNSLEAMLQSIWEQLLGKKGISVQSNFFKMGGHSLKAIRLQSRIRQTFNVEISIRDLFANPTIAQLSSLLDRLMGAGEEELVSFEVEEEI